jgi:hypothetical protein
MAKLPGVDIDLSTNPARLRWLVNEFLRLDVFSLSDHELVHKLGGRLLAFCTGASGSANITTDIDTERADLFKLQREIETGLNLVIHANPRKAGLAGWMVPLNGVVHVVRRNYSAFTGNRSAVVLAIAAELVGSSLGARIKTCAERNCGRFFYQEGRMRYCGPACGEKERARRYRQAHKEAV